MPQITRREWNKLAASSLMAAVVPEGALAGPQRINSKFNGVQVGAQSYSFRDRSLDEMIKAMVEIGLGSCELWQGHVEPGDLRGPQNRDRLRDWRLTVSLDEFKKIREKFDRAGVELYAYNLSMRDDFTDEEIERGFQMAKALGVKVMTASSNVTAAKRIDRFARQHKVRVGMHNHSVIRPNEFATPKDFADAMNGASEYIAINLDIGHFTAANFNAVGFLLENHSRIVSLHIKDRKLNQGPNVPFGQGDTPIKEVLALLRKYQWPISANIEYEYPGTNTIEEVKRCFGYVKEALK